MKSNRLLWNAFILTVIAGIAGAQSGGNFVIKDATVEGGAHVSSGGVFVKEVRLGQGVAGQSISGGNFAVGGGFYPAPPPPPPPVTLPIAPANLTATAAFPTQVVLTWVDNSNNEDGFVIERCTVKGKRCSAFAEIGQSAANTTDTATFSDQLAVRGTTYNYRVFAFNGVGGSGYSNVAAVKTPRR